MISWLSCPLGIVADHFWAYERRKDFGETTSVAPCRGSNCFAETGELTQQRRKAMHAVKDREYFRMHSQGDVSSETVPAEFLPVQQIAYSGPSMH